MTVFRFHSYENYNARSYGSKNRPHIGGSIGNDSGKSIIGLTYSPDEMVDDANEGILVLGSSIRMDADLSSTVYVKKNNLYKKIGSEEGDIIICSGNIGKSLHLMRKTFVLMND